MTATLVAGKVTIEYTDLRAAVDAVHISTGRSVQPILAGVRITPGETAVEFATFDFETSAQVVAPAVTVGEAPTVVVSGRLLRDIAKNLPKKPVEFSYDSAGNNKLVVRCGSARYELPVMPLEDYPQLPVAPPAVGAVPVDVFTDAVTRVAVAASKDDTLPMLVGTKVILDGETMTLASTDRFRLAVQEVPWTPVGFIDEPYEALVVAKTLTETMRSATGDNVALGLTASLFGLTTGGRSVTSRAIAAEFPRFRQLIPGEHQALAVVDTDELAGAVRRVGLMADRGAQVVLEFGEDRVVLTAGGADMGSATEEVPAQLWGDPVRIGFNPSYLLDGLGAVRSQRVEFGFTTPSRPAVLRPWVERELVGGGPFVPAVTDFLYLLMPVRLPG